LGSEHPLEKWRSLKVISTHSTPSEQLKLNQFSGSFAHTLSVIGNISRWHEISLTQFNWKMR